MWEDKSKASAKSTVASSIERFFDITIFFPVLYSMSEFYPGILKVIKHLKEQIHSHPTNQNNGKTACFACEEKDFILMQPCLMPLAGICIHAVHP